MPLPRERKQEDPFPFLSLTRLCKGCTETVSSVTTTSLCLCDQMSFSLGWHHHTSPVPLPLGGNQCILTEYDGSGRKIGCPPKGSLARNLRVHADNNTQRAKQSFEKTPWEPYFLVWLKDKFVSCVFFMAFVSYFKYYVYLKGCFVTCTPG